MIEFADSLWLYLIPVPILLLLLLFWIDRRGRRASIRRFASGRLISDLLDSYSPTRKRLKNALLLLSAVLLFLSLARPQWGHTWSESQSRGIDLVFALDSSRSMLANDIKPNRLIRAKLAIEDFVNQLEGDRIGLVAFSGSAFLQCPLTLDYDAFFQSLDAIDTNVISAGGTDIAAALQEAEAAFSSDNNFKILILITDGEDLEGSGVEQARKAAENGVTVYTVGVGTAEGSPIPVRTRTGAVQYVRDANGQVVQSRLDPETLESIAEETGGFYVNLGPTGYGLEQVLEAGVGSIPEEEISSTLQRTAIERYQWPLAAALFLLVIEPLIGTRRFKWRLGRTPGGSALLVMGIMTSLSVLPHHLEAGLPGGKALGIAASTVIAQSFAGGEVEREEASAPPDSPFARAVIEDPLDPIAHFNRGTELYEEQQYGLAAERFTEALRQSQDFRLQSDAFYNLGNTRFREGASGLSEQKPERVTAEAANVVQENRTAMRQGEQLLGIAQSGQNPPPQQVQGTIQLLQQREEETTRGIADLETSLSSENATRSLWQRSINDFESALELKRDHDDARYNLDFVKKQTADLTAEISRQEELAETQATQKERIRELIEKLRELLEDQQNQQDQQDQQNQQDQDQQQGQNDQNQNQSQSNESPSDQQSSQDQNQQSGDSPQQESGQENDTQRDSRQPQDNQEGRNDQGEESDDQETGEDDSRAGEEETEAEPSSTDETEDSADQDSPEEAAGQESRPEGADTGNPEEEDGNGPDEESIKLGEEQAAQMAREREQEGENTGVAEGDEGEPGEEIVLGVMSPEDAARLLDSLKNEERKLPFAGTGSEGATSSGNRRNW